MNHYHGAPRIDLETQQITPEARPAMASRRPQSRSCSGEERTPHDGEQTMETQTSSSLTEEFNQGKSTSNILGLDDLCLGSGYSAFDFSNQLGMWDDAAMEQMTGLDSFQMDPDLFAGSSLLDSEIAPQADPPASGGTNPWTQWQPVSPGTMAASQEQSSPLEADFPSQMRQLTMTNTSPRASLPRRRSRYLRSQGRSVAVPIKSTSSDPSSDPMQRWRHSPPETEAVSMSVIADALKTARPLSTGAESSDGPRRGLSRATSTGSFNSDRTSNSSRSAVSARSSLSRSRSRGAVAKTKRLANTKGGAKGNKGNKAEQRTFQCTFCCDSFKSKYDWSRHEKSLHLSLEAWLCTPRGAAVASPETGRSHCAYCNMLDPTPDHLETHNYHICSGEDSPRVFHRKDHLVQHLRLAHQLDTLPLIDDWKMEAPVVVSRCGFCDQAMASWKERVDHLAQHFRKGKTMEDWKGDHCFEPAVAAAVTNACPPYLLGAERKSLVPFSATDSATKDHYSQIHQAWAETHAQDQEPEREASSSTAPRDAPLSKLSPPPLSVPDPDSTFVQVLTLGLARFARGQMELGVVPTDEMFQNESRRLVYGSDDAWHQTIADNSEWLSTFRSHNIGDTPPAGDAAGSGVVGQKQERSPGT